MKRIKLLNATLILALGVNLTTATIKAETSKTAGEENVGLINKALMYLPLDEGHFMEIPKQGAELTVLGGKPVFSEGKKGKALVIDSEGVSVEGLKITGNNLMNNQQGTIAFWMKPLVNYEPDRRYYFLYARGRSDGRLIFIEKQSFFFQACVNSKWISPHFNFKWYHSPQWSTELWYHLAVTWGGGKETIFYVNGAPIHRDRRNVSFETPLPSLFIGCHPNKGQQADTLIDELFIFGDILNQGEILLLMN